MRVARYSWHGGKGASPRPVSLGRSSVHPGACGNHGTWPFVASLGLTLTLVLVVDSSTPSDHRVRLTLTRHAHMHDRTLMHTLRCILTHTLTLSTRPSLTLTAFTVILAPRRPWVIDAAVRRRIWSAGYDGCGYDGCDYDRRSLGGTSSQACPGRVCSETHRHLSLSFISKA